MIDEAVVIINQIRPSDMSLVLKGKLMKFSNLYKIEGNKVRKTIDAYGTLKYKGREFKVILEHRTVLSPSRFGKLMEKINSIPDLVIVCSEYITPKAKEELELSGISYVDGHGSIFIINSEIFIKYQVNKQERKWHESLNTDLSKKQALLIQWLLDNDFEKMSMRDIKSKANVSLGTVSNTLNNLIEKQFIKKKTKYYHVSNRQKLENYLVGKSND